MFKVVIKTGNAAFHEDDGQETDDARGAEVARILRDIAAHVENGGEVGSCMDVNGNGVGKWGYRQ